MKLTKQLEKEVMQVYQAYWDSYLNGDIKTFSSFLDDDFKVIDSSENEMFFNKKEAMKFYKATADQIAGKVEMRNRDIKIDSVDGLILISEQLEMFVLIETKWTFYSKGRLSSFLHKKENGWKFIQQHGSLPDTRAMEGEQISIKKISAENFQLRDAVKRRTVELEQKNRELEIEASLERVRTVAMSMNKPDNMLDVCRMISQQLELLKVKEIRNVQTAIIYESKGTYLNYEYYAKHDKLLTTEVDFKNHEVQDSFANQMLKGAEELFTIILKGKKLRDWYAYQKTTNQFVDVYLQKASSLNYYWYSLGPVALGISTYTPLNEEDINIFKRFRNVFALAYRRFIDIEQSEAHAREAKIEAALEKVRSRSLAMRKSDELQEVVHTVFEKLNELNVELYTAIIFIFAEGSKDIIWWLENKASQQYPRILVPYDDNHYLNDIFEAKENGTEFFSATYSFEEKNDLFHHLFENTDFKYVTGQQKKFLLESELATMSVALAKNTGINVTVM